MCHWENENWPIHLPNFDPKLDPHIYWWFWEIWAKVMLNLPKPGGENGPFFATHAQFLLSTEYPSPGCIVQYNKTAIIMKKTISRQSNLIVCLSGIWIYNDVYLTWKSRAFLYKLCKCKDIWLIVRDTLKLAWMGLCLSLL